MDTVTIKDEDILILEITVTNPEEGIAENLEVLLKNLPESISIEDLSPEIIEALEAGERGINIARDINYKLGVDESTEDLPKRLYQPLENGALEGTSMDKEKFIAMKKDYYQLMGWSENGAPLEETLKRLGI